VGILLVAAALLCVSVLSADERSFSMGLTPMNFNDSRAGTERMRQSLIDAGVRALLETDR